ncbi:hypothetical protein MMC10_011442 [Thelotrema lepadinum]|nr:hypothetical protein [Thelotrema lepadinum]
MNASAPNSIDIEANNQKTANQSQSNTGNNIGNWCHFPHMRRSTLLIMLFVLVIVVIVATVVPVEVGKGEQDKIATIASQSGNGG